MEAYAFDRPGLEFVFYLSHGVAGPKGEWKPMSSTLPGHGPGLEFVFCLSHGNHQTLRHSTLMASNTPKASEKSQVIDPAKATALDGINFHRLGRR